MTPVTDMQIMNMAFLGYVRSVEKVGEQEALRIMADCCAKVETLLNVMGVATERAWSADDTTAHA